MNQDLEAKSVISLFQLLTKKHSNCAYHSHLCTQKMGQKSKKGKQSQFTKNPTKNPRSWPHLPTQLLSIVAKQSALIKDISFGGNVTKSYRVPPSQCNPIRKRSSFPQLSDIDNGQSDHCREKSQCPPDVFNITFRVGWFWWYGPWPQPYYQCEHFVGYSHGVMVVRGQQSSGHYSLWDPVERYTWTLPTWDTDVPFKNVALSSSPRSYLNIGCTVMVLTGIHHPAFAIYELSRGEYGWSKQDCTLIDPYSSTKQLMQFTHAIGFKGTFYALSLQGTLAVIKEINSHFRITGLGTSRAVPSIPSMYFKEYLIESNWEILLVFLISRKSFHRVENVEVHRLQFDRLSWVKTDGIGDRTLFVGANCCMSVDATKVGCKRNCIYFTHQKADGWWVYDMERESISPGWNSNDSTAKSPVWDEPIAELQRNKCL